jgi:hypothetical protein
MCSSRAYGTRSLGFYPGRHWMRRANTSPMCVLRARTTPNARISYLDIIWIKSFRVKREIIIVMLLCFSSNVFIACYVRDFSGYKQKYRKTMIDYEYSLISLHIL